MALQEIPFLPIHCGQADSFANPTPIFSAGQSRLQILYAQDGGSPAAGVKSSTF
jgi:hypothetical protein